MKLLCRLMEISASGYYARQRKRSSQPPCVQRKHLAGLVRVLLSAKIGGVTIHGGLKRHSAKPESNRPQQGSTTEAGREPVKAIQPGAFKPKTTALKGTTAAPKLVEIRLDVSAAAQMIIGERYSHSLERRQVLLDGAVRQDKVVRRTSGLGVWD